MSASDQLAVSKRPSPVSSSHFVYHRIQWGGSRKFFGNEVRDTHPGAGYYAVSAAGGSGPKQVKYYDQSRYPNQGYSCIGCPHLLLDVEYGQPHCGHPHYVGLYGCPQSVTDRITMAAPPNCPMLGCHSERQQRRARWHHKSSEIFWRYYFDARLNPRRHGFHVYPRYGLSTCF